MTINDAELNELVVKIHLCDAVLDSYMRNAIEAGLFRELSDIEDLAHKAQIRLNKLRFPNG